jgi:hypothetical protein
VNSTLRKVGAFAVLASCTLTSTGVSYRPHSPVLLRRMSPLSNCPAYSGGTGILVDGDFSQAPDPGDHWPNFTKGQSFAPDWVVAKRNIDFAGSTAWGYNAGFCSVDLDGWKAGAIEYGGISTKRGATYTVTWEFSGNDFSCSNGSPVVKQMRVKAGKASQSFAWDTSSGNTVQNGDWAVETWNFQASGRLTVLSFLSEDPRTSNCGPVVGPVSVTQS